MAQPQKFRLEIPLQLPALPQTKDHCVARLIQALKARGGIANAHVADAVSGAPPELCIHYDPGVISVGKVQGIARAAGAELTDRFGHLLLRMDAMHARAARSLTAKLQSLQGVVEAEANAAGTIRLEFDCRQVLAGGAVASRMVGCGRLANSSDDLWLEHGHASAFPRRMDTARRHQRPSADWIHVTGRNTLISALGKKGSIAGLQGLFFLKKDPSPAKSP